MAPRPVHLVGSSPFTSTTEALTRFSKELPSLTRIPDGETNERNYFTVWQKRVFPAEILSNRFLADTLLISDPNFKLTHESLKSPGYADAALAAYPLFKKLRDDGVISPNVRFQVSLPTPINAVLSWVREPYMAAAETLYTRLILAELDRIQTSIPPSDLAIQWDMPQEIAHMEHTYNPARAGGFGWEHMKPYYADVREHITKALGELGDAVHADADLGFHLCYGDFQGAHWVEPLDAGILTDVVNGITENVKRDITYFHVPVPKDRIDEAYFAPLRTRSVRARRSALYLGLVHACDIEGTRKRLEAAQKVLGDEVFGIGSECGLGRTETAKLESIFEIYRRCSE